MDHRLCALCAVLLCALLVICAEGRPRRLSRAVRVKRTETLDMAQNKTVCPFVVVQNVNEDRRPRVLKEVVCVGHHSAVENCCGRHHYCVQLEDTVKVTNLDRTKSWPETIYVGCACMKIKSSGLERSKEPVID